MSTEKKKEFLQIAVLSILYVLIGNGRSIQPNPFIPGAVIAVYMVVPVVGGILFGCRVGFFVGIFGTLLNALSPAGSAFEFASIIPHGIMGMAAGCLRGKFPTPFVALTLLIGHILNIVAYLLTGLIVFSVLRDIHFWYGLSYEAFVGIMTVYVIATVYRMGFTSNK